MMTNVVDCDPDTLSIGQAVELVWKPAAEGTPVPCFTPCATAPGEAAATRVFRDQS